MSSKPKYVTTIDCLRGGAALSVCYYHLTWGNGAFLNEKVFLKGIGHYGYLGVQIFFIISGFILPFSMSQNQYSIRNFKIFIYKRLLRLDPPYIIVILLSIFLSYISTLSPYYRGKPFSMDLTEIALHLGYLTTIFQKNWINPVFWTLALEFQFYLILSIIFPLLIRKNIYLYIFLLLSLSLSLLSDSDTYIIKYFPFFSLGISFYFYYDKLLKIETFILIVLSIYCFILIRYDIYNLIASLIPLIIFYDSQLKNKVFLFLGRISYSIYLLHVPVGMRVINITEAKVSNIVVREVILLIDLAIVIFLSYLFYKLIERPSIELAKKLRYNLS